MTIIQIVGAILILLSGTLFLKNYKKSIDGKEYLLGNAYFYLLGMIVGMVVLLYGSF